MSTDFTPALGRVAPRLPIDGPPVPDPIDVPSVTISMNALAAVSGGQPGVAGVVTGKYSTYLVDPPGSVTVTADGRSFPATLGTGFTWTATVRFYRSGTLSVTAAISAASGESAVTPPKSVAVTVASPTVDITLAWGGAALRHGGAVADRPDVVHLHAQPAR